MLNVNNNQTFVNSSSVFSRYPGGKLLQNFAPNIFYMKLYAVPIWLIVGLFGNITSFFIWISSRQRRKNSSAVYLASLAFSDFLLILHLFVEYLQKYWFFDTLISIIGFCQLYQGGFLFFQYYSIVLTFGFTLERWIAICYPFQRHELCSSRRALISVGILALIVAPFTCFYAALWEISEAECTTSQSWHDSLIFTIFLTTMECIFSLATPLATLIFNVLVLREMNKLIHVKVRSDFKESIKLPERKCKHVNSLKLTNDSQILFRSRHCGSQSGGKEHSSYYSATTMLLTLSFYLILCTLPVGIVFLFQMRFVQMSGQDSDENLMKDTEWLEYLTFISIKELIDFLCSSHYACNFIIYVVTGKSFRLQLIDVLHCAKLKQLRGINSNMITSYVSTSAFQDSKSKTSWTRRKTKYAL